jgi:hypothetical protein
LNSFFPIPVDRGQPARGATAAEVEPADVFGVLIKGYADGDLELLAATWAGALPRLRILQVLVAVSDGMLGVAPDAGTNGRALVFVEGEPEPRTSARAEAIGEVVCGVAFFLL